MQGFLKDFCAFCYYLTQAQESCPEKFIVQLEIRRKKKIYVCVCMCVYMITELLLLHYITGREKIQKGTQEC